MREGRGDLQGHKPVGAMALLVDAPQHPERVDDVVDHKLPIRGLDAHRGDERAELLVVVVLALNGLREDGRVGRDAPHAGLDDLGEVAVAQPLALHVVHPRALALLCVQGLQIGHPQLRSSVPMVGSSPPTHSSSANPHSVTCSTVKPKWSSTAWPAPDAP